MQAGRQRAAEAAAATEAAARAEASRLVLEKQLQQESELQQVSLSHFCFPIVEDLYADWTQELGLASGQAFTNTKAC